MHAMRPPHPAARRVADVAMTAAAYLAARQTGDAETLEGLIASIWHGKHAITGEGLKLETRSELIARIRRGPENCKTEITSVQMCFNDFAIVRADAWLTPSTAMLLAFKERGVWLIAGEASAEAAHGERAARFASRDSEATVLGVLEDYYRAVTDGDPALVRSVFASCWHMKNHNEEEPAAHATLLAEETGSFAARLTAPLPGYWDDRQITDVQIAWDRLAYVRVDRPSTPSTTVFLFLREHGVWKIIDKAWTDGRKPDA